MSHLLACFFYVIVCQLIFVVHTLNCHLIFIYFILSHLSFPSSLCMFSPLSNFFRSLNQIYERVHIVAQIDLFFFCEVQILIVSEMLI